MFILCYYFITSKHHVVSFMKVAPAALLASVPGAFTVPMEPKQERNMGVPTEPIMMWKDSTRRPSVKTAGRVRLLFLLGVLKSFFNKTH